MATPADVKLDLLNFDYFELGNIQDLVFNAKTPIFKINKRVRGKDLSIRTIQGRNLEESIICVNYDNQNLFYDGYGQKAEVFNRYAIVETDSILYIGIRKE